MREEETRDRADERDKKMEVYLGNKERRQSRWKKTGESEKNQLLKAGERREGSKEKGREKGNEGRREGKGGHNILPSPFLRFVSQ